MARALPSVPPALVGNSGPQGGVGLGVSDYLWTLNLATPRFSIRRVIHKHSALSCFRPQLDHGSALSTTCSGRKFQAGGGGGPLRLSLDFLNLDMGGFDPPSDARA